MKKTSLILGIIALLIISMPIIAFANADITFEWNSNTETDMSHYNIYRSDDNQATWNKVNSAPIAHTGTGTETWTELGVEDGIYSWYCTAVDTNDNESNPSNVVTKTIDTQAPASPQNFIISLIQKIVAWLKGLFGGNFKVS